jgi:hypothetical protein
MYMQALGYSESKLSQQQRVILDTSLLNSELHLAIFLYVLLQVSVRMEAYIASR